MKTQPSSLRVGNVVIQDGRLWAIVDMQHTQPGKGGAYFQVELRDILSNTKQNKRWRSSEDIERAILDEYKVSYMYRSGESYVGMHQETFEQIEIPESCLGATKIFLTEGMEITVVLHEENIISAMLPNAVKVMVQEADAVVKGQTAASSFKSAVLENGVGIKVPPHITAGTMIVVNPNTGEYVEKAK